MKKKSTEELIEVGARVLAIDIPGMSGEHQGVVDCHYQGGYGIKVQGPHYKGTNSKTEVTTAVGWVEPRNVRRLPA